MSPVASASRPAGRYIDSPFVYRRFQSREVNIGGVKVGGNNPIILQSMTVADTMNTEATVREAIELYEAGSQLVRITAPGPKDAENLANIKAELRKRGYDFPVVADIHFAPKAALIAVEHVEKVRINPGNFADKKKFKVLEYSDAAYAEELERVRETFRPLVRRAKELGRALRIGTNHGSLSDRIMNRFGDTPQGMVESAVEFIQFARAEDFHDIVVSMKASNPQVMIQAYRLLIERYYIEGFDYPLHLGVTEAGDGRDGRIKSAVGIGALLNDGIGDTIRVSLTEDAVYEIPAARRIAAYYNEMHARSAPGTTTGPQPVAVADHLTRAAYETVNPYVYERFLSEAVQTGPLYLGSKHQHRIVLPVNAHAVTSGQLQLLKDGGADAFYVKGRPDQLPEQPDAAWIIDLGFARNAASTAEFPANAGIALDIDLADAQDETALAGIRTAVGNRTLFLNFLFTNADAAEVGRLEKIMQDLSAHVVYSAGLATNARDGLSQTAVVRILAAALQTRHRDHGADLFPILLRSAHATVEDAVYDAAIHGGALLLDGIGDGLLTIVEEPATPDELLALNLDLLQAVRMRLSKTEFISCPSCGRTLFDLQSTTARIKAKTGHLKGVKIAVMGCIVNGPGEMADADFGYVGAAPGHIHLYKGKEIVKANVPSDRADAELVQLLKDNDAWVDPA